MACMECSKKDLLRPFNAIIGIEMQRESKGRQDYWIHLRSWPSLSGHLNNFCINSLQKRCPHSRVLLVVLSQDLLSQHLMSTRSQILAISGTFWLLFGFFVHFWAILVLFGRSWVKIGDWGYLHTPNWIEASAKKYSNLFHAIQTVLDQQSVGSQSSVISGQFWTFLGHFGRPWAKIWGTLHTDTLPAVSKPQPRLPVTRSMPFQPFGTTRVLKVRFWPFLPIFGPFWPFLEAPGPKLERPSHSQLSQNFNQDVL